MEDLRWLYAMEGQLFYVKMLEVEALNFWENFQLRIASKAQFSKCNVSILLRERDVLDENVKKYSNFPYSRDTSLSATQ